MKENNRYGELGNILQVQSVGGAGWTRNYFFNTNPETDNNYQLRHKETGPDMYTYDTHGNMTQMPHLQSIGWDYADRMSYANLGGGGEVWYIYDARGERVRKVIKNRNIKEERLYLGGYEIYTKTNNGEVEVERETLHVYCLSRLVGAEVAEVNIIQFFTGNVVEVFKLFMGSRLFIHLKHREIP